MPALLLILLALRPAEREAPVRIDPLLFAGRAPGERVSSLIVLRAQADLSGAAGIGDRIEKRRFVYETLRAHAEATQAAVRRELEERGVPFRAHFLINMLEVEADSVEFLINMLEVEADSVEVTRLAERTDVAMIAGNRPWAATEPNASTRRAERILAPEDVVEPNLGKVGAPSLWARGITGQGVVVGVADTGFEWEHPALQAHYRGWDGSGAVHDYNWHDAVHDAARGNACGSNSLAPCDDNGHGTGVAGFAVGEGGGNSVGVAPGASLIGCRNMESGIGTPARYTECFEWFLAPTDLQGQNPRPDLGADVINNSWVCPVSEGCSEPDILDAVVENVRAAGVAMTFAAGNRGADCFTLSEAPAVAAASFTIGATSLDDNIAPFSAFGPVTSDGSGRLKPDLTAPGLNLRTAGLSGTYVRFSGTSAAAPHVAGAIALLLSAAPGLRGDVDAIEEILERSAVPHTTSTTCGAFPGNAIPNPVFGWGRLDAAAAVELATARQTPKLPAGRRPSPRTLAPRS